MNHEHAIGHRGDPRDVFHAGNQAGGRLEIVLGHLHQVDGPVHAQRHRAEHRMARILVIDDDASVRRSVRRMLERHGHHVRRQPGGARRT